jgi:L-methionine (R)-S-oxide reductase
MAGDRNPRLAQPAISPISADLDEGRSLMHPRNPVSGLAKSVAYRELKAQLAGLFAEERDGLANAANTTAALYHGLPDLNWAGFYFLRSGELVLGPFQGKVACVRIALGAGVCGTAAERRDAVLVPDVHAFPGHIACDANSRSEIVIPLIQRGRLLGVLDLDSPSLARFDDEDRIGLIAIVNLLLESSELSRCVD